MNRPPLDRWDAAAAGSALAVLAVAYLVVPHPVVQYGAWLVVFCLWMGWFFFYGTKWLYGVDI
jgi:hypothetical protein